MKTPLSNFCKQSISIRSLFVVPLLIALAGSATTASAALFHGNPFDDIAGSGTSSSANGSGNATTPVVAWRDQSLVSTAFIATGSTPLTYTERWSSAQTIESVILDTSGRKAGGLIYVATTPGGPINTVWGTFDMLGQQGNIVTPNVGAPTGGIYGVTVEVNSAVGETHYQIAGSLGLLSESPGVNLALSGTQVSSAGSLWNGPVNNERYVGVANAWRANTTSSEQWVGLEFSEQPVLGLRVVTAAQGDAFRWLNFNVQVKIGGLWVDQGQAIFSSTSADIYWGNFGTPMMVEGVRLFGSTALGNNPSAGGGLIVDEISLFTAIPEPSAFLLTGVGLGILLLCSRARRMA